MKISRSWVTALCCVNHLEMIANLSHMLVVLTLCLWASSVEVKTSSYSMILSGYLFSTSFKTSSYSMILTGYLNLIKNIYLGLMDASDLKIRRDTEFRFITWTQIFKWVFYMICFKSTLRIWIELNNILFLYLE